ncbi:ImmA/IrrE family metallo-endopeptidase [Flammeovirga yaeyamensis]|uniref:ImmA/IrrE family metallo-endopeptidase n=1 Tax=Flammeovirga yaeyamensis TaxID=367791 RepID=A0AAX1N8Y8_9BACT|nr:ImmA/IrrE family metallo-endopeptidase [Flammeovirga yaeyamensis]MBB3701251.1 Zn-dependent peptidase ImmA (M78 family) [Flammeovirga yaeyamensis]NMF38278.1 ImmA/IrrE family metallo-endopeptidase [Flammeovirga yaeyamensis]QWG02690.1 ImmA/IrrE family metallo-endopeptidase [Flammeovirga yaeyamensis]
MIKIKKIEEKADELLKQFNIERAHVNVEKIIKDLGIHIEYGEIGDTVSGFLLSKDGKDTIAVNHSQSEERQRFTLAHELGHFLFHRKGQYDDIFISNIHFRNEKSSTGEHRKEREANSFAAAILMPEQFIENEIEKIELNNIQSVEAIVKSLAKTFKVSEVAMTYRLVNLGYNI